MAAKKNLSLIFLLTTVAGFVLLWAMEAFIEAGLQGNNLASWAYFGETIQSRILQFGTENAILLIPQLKFRWLLLCVFGWWLTNNAEGSGFFDENRLRWRVRLFFVIQLLYIPECVYSSIYVYIVAYICVYSSI